MKRLKMIDPEKIITGVSKELSAVLKEMGKAKTTEEKLMHSEIIKNLCESLGVFFNLANNTEFMDEDKGPIPF